MRIKEDRSGNKEKRNRQHSNFLDPDQTEKIRIRFDDWSCMVDDDNMMAGEQKKEEDGNEEGRHRKRRRNKTHDKLSRIIVIIKSKGRRK